MITITPGRYGLIGMGAVFAGATRAAITAVIMLFELTGDYTIILPLMLAIVLATAVSRTRPKRRSTLSSSPAVASTSTPPTAALAR